MRNRSYSAQRHEYNKSFKWRSTPAKWRINREGDSEFLNGTCIHIELRVHDRSMDGWRAIIIIRWFNVYCDWNWDWSKSVIDTYPQTLFYWTRHEVILLGFAPPNQPTIRQRWVSNPSIALPQKFNNQGISFSESVLKSRTCFEKRRFVSRNMNSK